MFQFGFLEIVVILVIAAGLLFGLRALLRR